MKLQDCREAYYYNSGKASDICRNICFAGLAIIWAFKIVDEAGTTIPHLLRYAGVCLLLALAVDLLQYLFGTVTWGFYNRYKETRNEIDNNSEFAAPPQINWATLALFWTKQGLALTGWGLLIGAMYSEFWR